MQLIFQASNLLNNVQSYGVSLNLNSCSLFPLCRPLSAMYTDKLDLQDCLEHGRTAKVFVKYCDGTNVF